MHHKPIVLFLLIRFYTFRWRGQLLPLGTETFVWGKESNPQHTSESSQNLTTVRVSGLQCLRHVWLFCLHVQVLPAGRVVANRWQHWCVVSVHGLKLFIKRSPPLSENPSSIMCDAFTWGQIYCYSVSCSYLYGTEDYLRYGHGLISEYISEDLSKALLRRLQYVQTSHPDTVTPNSAKI